MIELGTSVVKGANINEELSLCGFISHISLQRSFREAPMVRSLGSISVNGINACVQRVGIGDTSPPQSPVYHLIPPCSQVILLACETGYSHFHGDNGRINQSWVLLED